MRTLETPRAPADGGVAVRLTFQLPPCLLLLAQPGRHQPCLHGCVLVVTPLGQVEISGPWKEQVFEQAARFLRVLLRGRRLPPTSIGAILRVPALRGCDSWTIIIGADISFAPTALRPHLVPAETPVPA